MNRASTGVLLFWIVVSWIAGIYLGVWASDNHFKPKCPKDAVIVGRGEFVNGRWTDYVCSPDYRGP